MNEKPTEENVDDQHKNTLFEDPNTANSSAQEEPQINSPITTAELNERLNTLSAQFKLLLDDHNLLKNKYDLIINDNTTLKNKYDLIINDNTLLKNKYDLIINDNTLLKKDNSQTKESNAKLQTRVELLEKKYDALESLVMRNNINVDLLANRDSLKSLLLLFSVNLNVTSIKEIKEISKNSIIKTKFTSLIISILKKLKQSLEQESSWRRKDQNQKAENTLSEEEKNEIKKKFIFVECIHFIICSIDNIVHPPQEKGCDVYSKLIGKRSKETLEKSLIHFFQNPRTMEELNSIIKKNKNRPVENDKNEEIKEIYDNGKKNDEPKEKKEIVDNIIKGANKNDEKIKEADSNMKTNDSINEKRKSEIINNAQNEEASFVENKKEKVIKKEEHKESR